MQSLAQNALRGGGEPQVSKISTRIPARLDRLPWSRFHLLFLGLGITWILEGIEVTIVGALAPVLRDRETLGLSTGQIGGAVSAYVASAVVGALVFGWLTDRFGRRLVFYVTLIVYLVGVNLTATSWSFVSFALFRGLTGLGIGGKYAAINSMIDELIPAKYRGRVDIIVNGSFWIGAAAGRRLYGCSSADAGCGFDRNSFWHRFRGTFS
jgi:MFS family permease